MIQLPGMPPQAGFAADLPESGRRHPSLGAVGVAQRVVRLTPLKRFSRQKSPLHGFLLFGQEGIAGLFPGGPAVGVLGLGGGQEQAEQFPPAALFQARQIE